MSLKTLLPLQIPPSSFKTQAFLKLLIKTTRAKKNAYKPPKSREARPSYSPALILLKWLNKSWSRKNFAITRKTTKV